MANYMIIRNSVEQAAWLALTSLEKADPTHFQGHKFKVVSGGFHQSIQKRGEIRETLGRKLDVSVGSTWGFGEYVLRVKQSYYAEEDQTLGTLADYKAYFLLNNPGGSPNNILYIADHFSAAPDYLAIPCVLYGDFTPDPLTTIIQGPEAYFMVSIHVRAMEALS